MVSVESLTSGAVHHLWGRRQCMGAYRIGQQLRAVILKVRQEDRTYDPRRLQAVIGDLCGDYQQELVTPLRYLVLSAAFARAAGMLLPISDAQ